MRFNMARALRHAARNSGAVEPSRERWLEIRRERDRRLLGVLTDEQRERFKQMQGQQLEIDVYSLFQRRGKGDAE